MQLTLMLDYANINATGANAHCYTAAPSIQASDNVTDGFSAPREKEHQQQQQSEAAEHDQEDAPTQTIHSKLDEGNAKELKHAVESHDSKKIFQEFKK